jgi:hypothetical protein
MEASISTDTYVGVSQVIELSPKDGPVTRTKVFHLLLEDLKPGYVVTIVPAQ